MYIVCRLLSCCWILQLCYFWFLFHRPTLHELMQIRPCLRASGKCFGIAAATCPSYDRTSSVKALNNNTVITWLHSREILPTWSVHIVLNWLFTSLWLWSLFAKKNCLELFMLIHDFMKQMSSSVCVDMEMFALLLKWWHLFLCHISALAFVPHFSFRTCIVQYHFGCHLHWFLIAACFLMTMGEVKFG